MVVTGLAGTGGGASAPSDPYGFRAPVPERPLQSVEATEHALDIGVGIHNNFGFTSKN